MNTVMRWKIAIIGFLIVSGLAYFWQVNALSTRGFTTEELEKAIQTLKTDSQKLELEVTAAQSMLNLDEQIKKLNLMTIQKVEYLQPVGPAMALRIYR